MSFISFSFLIFFSLLVICYHLIGFLKMKIGNSAILIQNVLLLASSFIFYAFSDLRFIPFLIYSIVVTYFSAFFCKNKVFLIFFLIADIVPLLAIKYCSLILQKQWIFPLGISFFTFQSVSYIVDTYTKKIPSDHNFLNIALFISFFPVISSGPIQRADKLIPQFKNIRCFDYDDSTIGMKIFAWGWLKKILIADKIAPYVNYVYGAYADRYGLALLLATFLYSFQIYCDFSGYSDMAIGVSRYLGFDVGKNFDHPYFSKSVGEFWRKWHISLSSWLRDYIYIPLGGSRVSVPRIYINLLVTFLVSGIWHGATWNFVVWGLLHGIFQCVGKTTGNFCDKKIPSPIRMLITFCLITFTWIFFRASNLTESLIIISKLIQIPLNVKDFILMMSDVGILGGIKTLFALDSGSFGLLSMGKIICLVLLFVIIEIITQKKDGIEIIKSKPSLIKNVLYIAFLYLFLFYVNFSSNTEFLYFNF